MASAQFTLPVSPPPAVGDPQAEGNAYLRTLWELLAGHRYLFNNEAELHRALTVLMERKGLAFEHEKVLSPACRVDFWLPLVSASGQPGTSGVVIEVKVQGSYADALRQAARYASLTEVRGVLIASTRLWAKQGAEPVAQVEKAPLMVVHLANRAF